VTTIRAIAASDDGFIAGLDRTPRICPDRYKTDESAWLEGYDEGTQKADRADRALAAVGL
jgi:ribosome modulation factor